MTWLQQIAQWLGTLRIWFTVMPWERAIRVRFGKRVTRLEPGLHFRIPFADETYQQNVRLRVLNLPVQTVTNLLGQTVTLSGVVRWRVSDIGLLYDQLHSPEDWILNTALASLASVVFDAEQVLSQRIGGDAPAPAAESVRISPMGLSRMASARFQEANPSLMGLEVESISITDMARVRTYRIINGEGNVGWSWSRVGALDKQS